MTGALCVARALVLAMGCLQCSSVGLSRVWFSPRVPALPRLLPQQQLVDVLVPGAAAVWCP